jgi:bacterioferritin (cytochrome b1)
MTQPPKSSKPPAAPPLPMQDELKKIIQYIAQVYKLQKEFIEKLNVVEKRINELESNLKTIIAKNNTTIQSSIKTTVEKSTATTQSDFLEAIEKLLQTTIKEEILPQLVAATPKTPPSPPARRPSDIPDARISTVVEELENIVQEIKGRQKVQREALRPMLEQARDVAMNNLASRAVAAKTFKELINIVKNAPFEVPQDIIETVITKIEELSLHIRS